MKIYFDINNKTNQDVSVKSVLFDDVENGLGILCGMSQFKYGIGNSEIYVANDMKLEVIPPGVTEGCCATVSTIQKDNITQSKEYLGEIMALGKIRIGNQSYYIDLGKIMEEAEK